MTTLRVIIIIILIANIILPIALQTSTVFAQTLAWGAALYLFIDRGKP